MSHATLVLTGLVCGAVGMFGLGMKSSDKFWLTGFFGLAALNTILNDRRVSKKNHCR
jgi:hypothetical protein